MAAGGPVRLRIFRRLHMHLSTYFDMRIREWMARAALGCLLSLAPASPQHRPAVALSETLLIALSIHPYGDAVAVANMPDNELSLYPYVIYG